MSHCDAYGIQFDGEFEEGSQIDECSRDAAVRYALSVKYFPSAVQVSDHEFLAREVVDHGVDVFVEVGAVFYEKIFPVGFFGREATA